ncbi:GTP 3',8-cyclase MoaA [Francisellaceae bacterium]|nr:GTP 3',8-cyclase MoaA [Francisellaceae bacterium]
MQLSDKFGRRFNYLRLSITDVCNFRCQYCLPNGYCGSKTERESFLNVTEISHLLAALTELGLKKIRLTGGEPTLRKDFIDIVSCIKKYEPIKQIAVTTNAYTLYKFAQEYKDAGITNVTISLDSLTQAQFSKITQTLYYSNVIKSIDAAIEAGFSTIKLNAVLLKGLNDTDEEITHFFNYVKNKSITVRFIEMMETGDNHDDYRQFFSSTEKINDKLYQEGWQLVTKSITAGPAREYEHPGFEGKIGIISPYSKIFCSDCNRIRVNSKGNLHVCLFDKCAKNLRHLLQHESQKMELINFIVKAFSNKDISHFLHDNIIGGDKHFSSIGG